MASKKRLYEESLDSTDVAPNKKPFMQRDYEFMSESTIADFGQDYIIYHVSQSEAAAVSSSPFVEMSTYASYLDPEETFSPTFSGFVNELPSEPDRAIDLQQKVIKLRVDVTYYGDLGLVIDFNMGVTLEKALACAVEFLKKPSDAKFVDYIQKAESIPDHVDGTPRLNVLASDTRTFKCRGDALGACLILEDVIVKDGMAATVLAPI